MPRLRMSLSLQPLELLEAVASFIRLPCDLLSLALTSKALNTIVIPEHLEFHEVSCDPYRTELCITLAERPVLAVRILSLTLEMEPIRLDSSTELVVPRSVVAPKGDPVHEGPSVIWMLGYLRIYPLPFYVLVVHYAQSAEPGRWMKTVVWWK
ncbi:hypothetical protein B0H17DRAFT_1093552 [Mycena rosella]|uniref:F-box domain-containing protein n=1 Tax=Mycena rosella TaxID=1033263 RepID=A0AAD7CTP3_MYCRO|nr:hypothetical protein B0H17DRAFT_1093552 [Mycena rosella]